MVDIELKPLTDRKAEILQAATQLFSQKGYLATSMRDLAEVLDIKPASLYSHYVSKDEMLWEIAVRSSQKFHEKVLPLAEGEGTPLERLEAMIRMHIDIMIENVPAAAIFFREWTHLEEPRRTTYGESIRRYRFIIAGVVKEGIEAGQCREGSPRFLTSLLLASINWLHQWYKPEGRMSVEEIEEAITTFILQGLKK
ncbi:MAG: TetR/AcrR family transcriptional regulator [Bacteroidota bacterium]